MIAYKTQNVAPLACGNSKTFKVVVPFKTDIVHCMSIFSLKILNVLFMFAYGRLKIIENFIVSSKIKVVAGAYKRFQI